MASKHLEKRRQALVASLRGMAELERNYVAALEALEKDFAKAYEAQQRAIERAVERWETASDAIVVLEFQDPAFFTNDPDALRDDAEAWISESESV